MDELKQIIASNDTLKTIPLLFVHLREASLIYQQQTAKDGKMDIKSLLKGYIELSRMEGVDDEMAFRFNIENAFICYRSGDYSVCNRQKQSCIVRTEIYCEIRSKARDYPLEGSDYYLHQGVMLQSTQSRGGS